MLGKFPKNQVSVRTDLVLVTADYQMASAAIGRTNNTARLGHKSTHAEARSRAIVPRAGPNGSSVRLVYFLAAKPVTWQWHVRASKHNRGEGREEKKKKTEKKKEKSCLETGEEKRIRGARG